jgi:hypothetical protein
MPDTEMKSGIRGGGKFDKAMYARRPDEGEHRRWITVVSRTKLEDYMIRGFVPLWKYGYIQPSEPNRWTHILQHPDGPAEFPAEQVMVLRWYKPEDCPHPGVKFAQLGGHKVKEYKCPECKRTSYAFDGLGGIEPLGRHLRIHHKWDRASLVKYGEAVGIDFDAIYSSIEKTYEFEPESAPEPERIDETGLVTVGEFDCDECDWKPKANAKKPGFALMMHKRTHKEPVPA